MEIVTSILALLGGLTFLAVFLRVRVNLGAEIKMDAGVLGRRKRRPRK